MLGEMLGSVNDSTGGGWKVLVMDAFTTKITSAAVRMSDILDAGELGQHFQQRTLRKSVYISDVHQAFSARVSAGVEGC